MTRRFADEPVDRTVVETIFADALFAPSAGGSRGAEFLVLSTAERRSHFWHLVADEGWRGGSALGQQLTNAPVVAICLVDPDAYRRRYAETDKATSRIGGPAVEEWHVAYPTVDAAFATMIALLGVEAAGLGALFFHLQGRERLVLDGFGVPATFETIGALAIGHRAPNGATPRHSPGRRDARATRVHFEHFTQTP